MKKFMLAGMIISVYITGGLLISAPKSKKIKKTESQKMEYEINRIEKRVKEIQKNIEAYKENEKKLDELEKKAEETSNELNY